FCVRHFISFLFYFFFFFFFFQAEDGIRDFHVTGVQTCALPISRRRTAGDGRNQCTRSGARADSPPAAGSPSDRGRSTPHRPACRSEERRVGKECRAGWWRK